MNKIRITRITHLTAIGFATVVLLFLVAGGTALFITRRIEATDVRLAHKQAQLERANRSLALVTGNVRVALQQMLLGRGANSDSLRELSETQKRNTEAISRLIAEITETGTPAEKELLDRTNRARVPYLAARDEARQAFLRGDARAICRPPSPSIAGETSTRSRKTSTAASQALERWSPTRCCWLRRVSTGSSRREPTPAVTKETSAG